MRTKAAVVKFKPPETVQDKKKRLPLDSGREILVTSTSQEELIRIIEPEGNISLTMRMTGEGPVITVCGARLELKSTETISLEAKKIEMRAEESATLQSKGSVDVDSAKKMDIHSADEIRIDGKMIHLN